MTPVANLLPVSLIQVAIAPLSLTLVANLLPLLLTPVANLPVVSTTPSIPAAKFTAIVIDTRGKFANGVNDTGGAQ
jgi:hypothetical protein